jgi:hypothetical protein
MFAPAGEKRLYEIVKDAGPGVSDGIRGVRCKEVAERYPHQRIAALTLSGIYSLKSDPRLAVYALGQVLLSGVEIANDSFLIRYWPMGPVSFPVDGREVVVPVSRDLVATLLVIFHMQARQFDFAMSAAKELKDTPVARDLRLKLDRVKRQARVMR